MFINENWIVPSVIKSMLPRLPSDVRDIDPSDIPELEELLNKIERCRTLEDGKLLIEDNRKLIERAFNISEIDLNIRLARLTRSI